MLPDLAFSEADFKLGQRLNLLFAAACQVTCILWVHQPGNNGSQNLHVGSRGQGLRTQWTEAQFWPFRAHILHGISKFLSLRPWSWVLILV